MASLLNPNSLLMPTGLFTVEIATALSNGASFAKLGATSP